jgi:hypothetical protein
LVRLPEKTDGLDGCRTEAETTSVFTDGDGAGIGFGFGKSDIIIIIIISGKILTHQCGNTKVA